MTLYRAIFGKSSKLLLDIFTSRKHCIIILCIGSSHFDLHYLDSSTILSNKKVFVLENKYPTFNKLDYKQKLQLLKEIKNKIELEKNVFITGTIVGVSNNYSIKERLELSKLFHIAGFDRIRITSLLIASLISINSKLELSNDKKCLLVDFNKDYCELLVSEIGEGIFKVENQLFTYNISENFLIKSIFDIIVEDFLLLNDIDLRKNSNSLERIKNEVYRNLKAIILFNQRNMYIPNIYSDGTGIKNIDINFDNSDIDNILDNLIGNLQLSLENLISMRNSIAVIISGWIGRIPVIENFLKDNFSQEIYYRNNESIYGLAYLGGMYSKTISGVVLIDILPYGISIENNGKVTNIIPKGTTIPTTKTHTFTISEDFQKSVGANIIEEYNNDTKLLGNIQLENIPPQKKENTKIEIGINVSVDMKITVQIRLIDSVYYNTVEF